MSEIHAGASGGGAPRKTKAVDPEVARILWLHDFVVADEGLPGEGGRRRRHSHGRFALIIHKVLAF